MCHNLTDKCPLPIVEGNIYIDRVIGFMISNTIEIVVSDFIEGLWSLDRCSKKLLESKNISTEYSRKKKSLTQ